jgi:hypothetical protein
MPAIRLGAALALAVLAGPGLAEEMTMIRAIEAASLHEGPLDMVAYYEPAASGAFEVTATFAPHEPSAYDPMRIVMLLGDGDDVAFAMPGYPEALYRFIRAGAAVTVSVRRSEWRRRASDRQIPGASGRQSAFSRASVSQAPSASDWVRPTNCAR